MFKNMKFEVSGNLDEIVVELEKLGYKKWFCPYLGSKLVVAFDHGLFDMVDNMNELINPLSFKSTTLAELKEML